MNITRIAAVLLVTVAVGCSSDNKKPENGYSGGSGGSTTKPEPHIDQRDYLQSVLLVPWPKDGAGLKVGTWVEIKNTTGGKTSVNRVAVVGDAGAWFNLEESSDGFLGYIEGLTVEKSDGRVKTAVAAKKGEPVKAIKVGPIATPPAANAETTSDESVTVPAGTFAAKKSVVAGQLSDTTTWIAKDGDVRGLVVKWTDEMVTRELKSFAIEDKALHLSYSDGSEEWWVRDQAVPFYGTTGLCWIKQSRGGTTTELTWGEDAKPDLDWTAPPK